MGTPNGTRALSADACTARDAADWKRAHAALSRIARERAQLDAEEGRWLLRALRSAAHVHLGFASFAEYIERLFGYRPRSTQEKLRVAEALEGLPRLARALETGALGWCAARELTRVAVAETEAAWLEVARGKTLRELESLVASKSPGDKPDAPPAERPRRRVLRFEVAPETFATFREAMLSTRRQSGGPLDDDALLLAMARHILAGPRDEGRASYQISLHLCSACRAGAQAAAGELVPVDAAVIDMAQCDSQHLGDLLPSPIKPSSNGQQRPANENASLDLASTADERAHNLPIDHVHAGAEPRRHAGPPVGSNRDGGSAILVSPSRSRSSIESSQSNEATCPRSAIESSSHAHVGSADPRREKAAGTADAIPPPAADAPRPSRARQTIPPALRRAVLARDRHRCTVPGCTHATFVDVHHVQPRSEGGRHEASNLLTLCSAHHRAAHRGELHIERDPDHTIRFRHADGATYGTPLTPRLIDAHTKVFSALRNLGFPESAAKTVLGELRADAELATASVARLLREALCRIRLTAR